MLPLQPTQEQESQIATAYSSNGHVQALSTPSFIIAGVEIEPGATRKTEQCCISFRCWIDESEIAATYCNLSERDLTRSYPSLC